MTQHQRHIVVQPAENGSVDFSRADSDCTGQWFRNPTPQWLPVFMPGVVSDTASGRDLTFSTFRRFGYTDPNFFTLPDGGNYIVRCYAPLGKPWEADMWGTLTWYSPSRPPLASPERFHVGGGGLRRQLAEQFKPESYDAFRELGKRPRYEIYVRWGWRLNEIAPDAFPIPAWMAKIGDLTGAEAAAAMNAFRQPTSASEALRIKAQDRAGREAAKRAAADTMPAEAVQAEAALAQSENGQPAAAPVAQGSDSPPTVTREQLLEARNRKTKMAKATRAKVAADKANAESAKAWGEKVVRKMEAAAEFR